MDYETLTAIIATVILSFGGLYGRISALESRLTAHVDECNGRKRRGRSK